MYIGTIEESFLFLLVSWLPELQKKSLWMKDKW